MIDDWDFDISELGIEEYPYIDGEFYSYEVNLEKPLDERVSEEAVVFETRFDAQEAAKLHNGMALNADYAIFWPLEINPESHGMYDKYVDTPVKRGMRFRGIANGVLIDGEVELVVPSQLGGAKCYIKVTSESEY